MVMAGGTTTRAQHHPPHDVRSEPGEPGDVGRALRGADRRATTADARATARSWTRSNFQTTSNGTRCDGRAPAKRHTTTITVNEAAGSCRMSRRARASG